MTCEAAPLYGGSCGNVAKWEARITNGSGFSMAKAICDKHLTIFREVRIVHEYEPLQDTMTKLGGAMTTDYGSMPETAREPRRGTMTTGLHLYDLTDMYRRLLDEDDAAYDAALDQLAGDISEKATNVAAVRAELLAEAEAIKHEEERLRARRQARENRADSLKAYLYENMMLAELTEVKDARFSLRIQQSPMSVEVLDAEQVPDRFCRVERLVDKRALLEAVKGGQTFQGVAVVTGKTHLVIR